MEFDDKNKDKKSPCSRTFDIIYRGTTHDPAFSIDTNIAVRIAATDAREALTFIESNKFLSEKLKGMYLVSIT